jgi:hypothetical protein
MLKSTMNKSRKIPPKSRKIPPLLFTPNVRDRFIERQNEVYQWFRRGDNRFNAKGIHGYGANLMFSAFDRGLKELPYDEASEAFALDMAGHTRRRFAGRKLVSTNTIRPIRPAGR